MPDQPLQKPPSSAPQPKPKSGAKGCLLAFVITVVVVIVVGISGGYYAIMHSSWPLTMMADLINESGDAEIKGLKGSLATGFSADELRIFETGLTDTYFTNISFKYNGISDVSGKQRLIVDEFVIGKAYLSLPEVDDSDSDSDLDFNPELDDLEGAEELENTGYLEVKTFRIDEIVVQNPNGEERSGSVLLSGLQAHKNDFRIEELKVTGDFLEMNLESLPETNQFKQAIKGVVKATIHEAVRQDIDFVVEFGGAGNAEQAAFTLFGGQVKGRQKDKSVTTEYFGLTISEYLDPAFVSLPDDLVMKSVTPDGGKKTEFSAGSFRVGQTKFSFEAQTTKQRDPKNNALVSTAKIGEQIVTLRIPDVEDSGRMKYEFSSEGMELPEIVAQVLFGKQAADLSEEEQEQMAMFAKNHRINLEPTPTPAAPAEKAAATNAPAKKE